MPPKIMDILERAGWTLAQAAVAFGLTEVGNVSTWWAIPLATALSALKTFILSKEGK